MSFLPPAASGCSRCVSSHARPSSSSPSASFSASSSASAVFFWRFFFFDGAAFLRLPGEGQGSG